MALITPNFSEVTDQITPGQYNVRITNGEMAEYKTGTKYVKWTLETFGEADAKNEGRKIWHSTPIEGKGAFLVQQLWKAATGSPLTDKTFDTEMLNGKEVQIVADVNDKGYTEIKTVRPMQ